MLTGASEMSFGIETPVTVTLTMGKLYGILAVLFGLFAATISGVWWVTTAAVCDIRHNVGEIAKA